MVNILKSKKGGIPAVNEIVMTVLNVTPRPILLLIFIVLLTVIGGFVVPLMLNLFGYDCVYEKGQLELYQVPMSSVLSKSLTDVKQGLRGIVGFEDYTLPDDPFPDGDARYLRVPTDCFVDAEVNGTLTTGYSSACVDCNSSGIFRYWNSICTSDGFYDPDLVTKYWIGTANFCYKCAPPEPYYYNQSFCNGQAECWFVIKNESLVSGISDTYIYDFYLQNIKSLGGVKRVQDDSELINIQCADYKKPTLFVFSLELLDKTMWIILIVGGMLISLAYGYFAIVLK